MIINAHILQQQKLQVFFDYIWFNNYNQQLLRRNYQTNHTPR